jgi:hypothetical protein
VTCQQTVQTSRIVARVCEQRAYRIRRITLPVTPGSVPTDQDIQVINHLVSQGADCKVPLSFLMFNSKLGAGLAPTAYKQLLPMMQSCAH